MFSTTFLAKKGMVRLLLVFFLFSALPALLEAQTYRILPLGNSITHGKPEDPGYRYPLYELLTEAYIDFQYVGSMTSASMPGKSPASCLVAARTIPELKHEGHRGWRADEILNGKPANDPGKLSEWLQSYTPDVVLMHVGTNDMFQNRSVSSTLGQLREIVRQLRQDNPQVIILMAKLIPAYPDSVGQQEADNILRLNSDIPALVQELHTTASPVLLVDQQSGFNPTPGEDTFDGIHTNARGSAKMAAKWFEVLKTVLERYTNPPEVSLSAPAGGSESGLGQAMTISATASDPEGALRLVEFFANCQKIGEDSSSPYSISWTPSQTGTYSLQARATDAAGAKGISSPVEITVIQDAATEAPLLHKPVNNTLSRGPIALEFSLPEAAKAGTVKLTFSRTAGAADAGAPHILTLSSAYETAERHALSLSATDLGAQAGVAAVSSSPNDALVSGATYSITLSYQDRSGNAAATATKTGFAYDATPPAAPEKPRLASSSDTGISNSDGITANATPLLQGTAEANAQLAIYLNGAVLATTTATAQGSWSYTLPAAKALAQGTHQLRVKATDAAGNESAASAVLQLVIDQTPPVVQTNNKTVQLSASGKASITPAELDAGSTDAVSPKAALRYTLSQSSFSCEESGQKVEVEFTVVDEAGNSASATARVEVVDEVAPALQVQDVALRLGAAGTAALTASDAVVATSDNCGTTSISFSRTTFGCGEVGKSVPVSVVALDAAGNKTEKTITVTVSDTGPPVVRVNNLSLQLDEHGQATITAEAVDAGSADNCRLASIRLDKTTFTCTDLGANRVTLTATDAAGNKATAVATVTVQDLAAPVLQAGQQFQLDENSAAATVLGQLRATDNCGLTGWEIKGGNTENAFALNAAGNLEVNHAGALDYEKLQQFVLQVRAKDRAGNHADGTITITLNNLNDQAPELAVPSELTGKELEAISFTATATDADGNASFAYSLEGEVPAGAALDAGSGLFSWVPAEDQNGEYSLTVVVSDGSLSSKKSLKLLVQEVNQAPQITSTPAMIALVGEAYSYQLIATDADLPANTLSYSAENLPPWLSFDMATRQLLGTPAEEEEGEYSLSLRVSDGEATVEQEFTLIVAPPTGIADGIREGVKLYPNPSAGSITLEIRGFPAGETAEALLLGIDGKALLRTKGSPQQISAELSRYLSGSSAGMYLLQLQWQEQRTTHKLIRQ